MSGKIYCDDHSSLSSTIIAQYEFHIDISLHGKIWTQQIDLAPNVWLHSSVGRASHRYRGGDGFKPHWSPDIFQASSFQLLKLENLINYFTFIYNSSPIWISYIFHFIKMLSISKSYNCWILVEWLQLAAVALCSDTALSTDWVCLCSQFQLHCFW